MGISLNRPRIWLSVLLFLGAIKVIAVIELVQSHRSHVQVAYAEAGLSGFLVAEWIEKSLNDIQTTLRSALFDLYEQNLIPNARFADNQSAINRRLRFVAEQHSNIVFLGIFNRDCTIIYGSISHIIGESSRALERAYCDNVTQPPLDALKFSDLFISSTGDLNVSATYPLLLQNDQVSGFALAGLNLNFFQYWLDSVDHPAITISIIDSNQILLARKPDPQGIGERIEDVELADFIQGGTAKQTFRHNSPVDGVDRLWNLRRAGEFPFIVAVGYRLDEVLIPWRAKLIAYSVGYMLLLIVTVSLALAYQRNATRSRSMEALAMQDSLTGLMNRRSFNTMAKVRFIEAQAACREDCIIMIDIDYFKRLIPLLPVRSTCGR